MAGIFGPVLVNYIREYNVTHGVAAARAYNVNSTSGVSQGIRRFQRALAAHLH
jgi:hypothetical protein